jgi:hypothetical protein
MPGVGKPETVSYTYRMLKVEMMAVFVAKPAEKALVVAEFVS